MNKNTDELEMAFDFCFNEYLKICDFLCENFDKHPKIFATFVLQVFAEKIKEREKENLIPKKNLCQNEDI